jgi:ribosomal protein S18 acetylase RimI-like enzyme
MLLRPAEPADAMAVARVHVRSWQVAYRTLLPDEYLDQLRPEDRAQRYDFTHQDPNKPFTLIATEGEEVCGFVTTMPSRDNDLPQHGELCALYVDPGRWHCGIGCALIAAARSHLSELGFPNALLWVMRGNARAARFYDIDKWASDGECRKVMVWSVIVEEVRYRRVLDVPVGLKSGYKFGVSPDAHL